MLGTRELAALAKALSAAITEHVSSAVKALTSEISRLEKRIADLPAPEALPDVVALVSSAVAAIPVPADGKSITPADVAPMLAELVRDAVSSIPAPVAGKDADPEVMRQMVAEQVAALPPARDGADADVEAIKAAVLALIPPPADGKSPTADELRPLVAEEVSKAVAAIPAPAAPDMSGFVTVEALDAFSKSLPAPQPGLPGKDADPAEIQAMVQRAVDAIPRPADGKSVTVDDIRPALESELAKWALDFERRAHGVLERAVERMPKAKDGIDGMGFDDLTIEHDGERGFTFKLQRGEQIKQFEFTVPAVIDRGVYKEGTAYSRGDAVTWAGSLWVAQKNTSGKPDSGDGGFRLAVKKGRDGKDGRDLGPRPTPPPVKL